MSFDDIEFSDAEAAVEPATGPPNKKRRLRSDQAASAPTGAEAGPSKTSKRVTRKAVAPVVHSDAESVAPTVVSSRTLSRFHPLDILCPLQNPRARPTPRPLERIVVEVPAISRSTMVKYKPAPSEPPPAYDSPAGDSDFHEDEGRAVPGPASFTHAQYSAINRDPPRKFSFVFVPAFVGTDDLNLGGQPPVEILPPPPMMLIPHDQVLDGLLAPEMHVVSLISLSTLTVC